jgi:hypothetical protein
MSGDTHVGFIIAAYGAGFVLIGGMILVIILDYLRLKRALTRLGGRTGFEDQARP